MGWWITLGVLILLAILPLGGRVHYDSQGIRAWILAGPIRVGVYPLRKKPGKKPKKEKAPPNKEEQKEAPLPQPPQPPKPEKKAKGGSLTDFLPFVRLGGEAVCWKGPAVAQEEVDGRAAARRLGVEWLGATELCAPGEERRHILVRIQKNEKTLPQYPRKNGMPAKRPLKNDGK